MIIAVILHSVLFKFLIHKPMNLNDTRQLKYYEIEILLQAAIFSTFESAKYATKQSSYISSNWSFNSKQKAFGPTNNTTKHATILSTNDTTFHAAYLSTIFSTYHSAFKKTFDTTHHATFDAT
jgi:hypothetical protein